MGRQTPRLPADAPASQNSRSRRKAAVRAFSPLVTKQAAGCVRSRPAPLGGAACGRLRKQSPGLDGAGTGAYPPSRGNAPFQRFFAPAYWRLFSNGFFRAITYCIVLLLSLFAVGKCVSNRLNLRRISGRPGGWGRGHQPAEFCCQNSMLARTATPMSPLSWLLRLFLPVPVVMCLKLRRISRFPKYCLFRRFS